MGQWLSIENVPPIPDIFDFHRSIKDILNPNPINHTGPDGIVLAFLNGGNFFTDRTMGFIIKNKLLSL